MVKFSREERNTESVGSAHSCLSIPQMSSSPKMAGALLFLLLVTAWPVPGNSFNMLVTGTDLVLVTTNSAGYAITVPPEDVNSAGATILTLEFIPPIDPSALSIFVNPTPSLFQVNANTFVITTNEPLTTGVYEFTLILYIMGSGVPPFPVDVEVTVSSHNMACELATCSQKCHLDAENDFTCSCIEGYSLQLDQLTCLANAPSPRLLISHSASMSSFDLGTRQLSPLFQLTNGSGSIDVFDYDYQRSLCYYADNTHGLIARVSLNSPAEEVVIISQGLGIITGLAVDWISGNVYYTDSTMGRVYQYHSTSGSSSVVLEGLVNPRAIALAPEPEFRFLFLVSGSDPADASILRAPMNGSQAPISIATATNPVDLAVDVVLDKLMVVTSAGSVMTLSFDGQNLESIVSVGTEPVTGGGIFEDYIYVTRSSTNTVIRYNKFPQREETPLDFSLPVTGQLGGVRVFHPLQQPTTADADECLVSNGGCSHHCVNTIGSFYCTCPLGYTLGDDTLTCININECDPSSLGCAQGCRQNPLNSSLACTCNTGYQIDSNGMTCSDINECETIGICSHACVNSEGGYQCKCPSGLFIGPDQHTCVGCSINNGGCSQLCVTSGDHFECQCQHGYQLGADKTSCFREPVEGLLFSATFDSFDGGSLIVRTLTSGIVDATILYPFRSGFEPTGLIYGMDIDVEKGLVYYSDRNSSKLMTVPLYQLSSSSDQRQEVLGGVKAWGIVFDWVTGYLYWTEDETGRIRRTVMNSSDLNVEDFIMGLQNPRGLAIDPINKYIYWTESGASPRVARASLFSSPGVPQTLTSTGLSSPSGISIDFYHSRLYWADESTGTIQSLTLNGEDQTIFVPASLWSPFQLVVAGESLVVTSSNNGSQEYRLLSLISDSDVDVYVVEMFQDTGLKLHGVAVIDENKQSGNGFYQCLTNAMHCSHSCEVDASGQPVCQCPFGYILLSDQRTCVDAQPCFGEVQDCAGGFANITGTAFFVRPMVDGEALNLADNPIQLSGQDVNDCNLVSAEYLSQNCQYNQIPDNILSVQGSSVIGMDPDNPTWGLINSKLVKLTVQCSSPLTQEFCLNFEVSTINAALTCGFSNGGCSFFCSNPFGPIPVCSCPFGEVLGLDGYTCTDPCNPNPCHNAGECVSSSNAFTCNCPQGFTGLLCEASAQVSCPEDLCNDFSPSVDRLDSGDRVEAAITSTDDTYCSAIKGYCTGGAGQCEACLCKPGLTYRYDTFTCSDLSGECSFHLQSSSTVATVYPDGGQFLAVAGGDSLPIVSLSDGLSLPSGCQVSTLEVNGGDGWASLDTSGIFLHTSDGETTLQIGTDEVIVNVDQLSGHLLKINFTCSEISDCFLMKVAGGASDPSTGTCNDCLGNFRGLQNLGVPEFPRPASDASQNAYIPLTMAPLQHDGVGVQGCSIVGPVQYYDDSCGLIPIPQSDLITISVNPYIVMGQNAASASNSWDVIAGKLINLTLTCSSHGSFCVLFRVGPEAFDNDPCDPSPCENNGECTRVGTDNVLCSCMPGFTGLYCSEIDYCANHTCLNGGTCIIEAGVPTCFCPEDTVPPYCLGPINSNLTACFFNPCDNGGTCIEGGPNIYYCKCMVGYTGLHCNTVDQCAVDPPVCSSNATCISNGTSYYCVCPNGEIGSCGAGGAGGNPSPSTSEPQPSSASTTHNVIISTSFIETSFIPEPSISPTVSPCDGANPCMNNGTCFIYGCECAPGYTGSNCQEEIDPCEGDPCQNGATCVAGITDFSCICILGYTGPECQTNIDDCESNPCQNGATCEDGIANFTCICVPGYSGINCSNEINECEPNPCQNGGTCEDKIANFTCICALGFTGPSCQMNIDDCEPDPCQNGATCVDLIANFTCDCALDFTGSSCQTNIDDCESNPCQNGATCEDGIANFTCICAPGYSGVNCSNEINECEPNPCQNGGTCEDKIANFTCVCALGFTGPSCQMNIDDCESNPCQNGATCMDLIANFTCDCAPDFTGSSCQTNIDDCESNPCQNGATCEDGIANFTCICAPGYSGVNCSDEINECEPNPCQNGATCQDEIANFTCICVLGFTGPSCQMNIDDCEPDPCQNGATCVDLIANFTCDCASGFTGSVCETNIDDCESGPCLNEATCIDGIDNFTCECALGFSGSNCETNIDDCDPNPCNNGSCTDGVNSFICDCVPGYTGANCSVDINECASTPCENGRCVDGVNSFICECSPGFTGSICNVNIDDCANVSCQNGGTCRDEINAFLCICLPGFNGTLCEAECPRGTFGMNCTGVCTCLNGANCSTITGFCTCAPGYTGLDCGDAICNIPCQNGGTCIEPDVCLCEDSFTGPDCTDRECTPTYCKNGGTCSQSTFSGVLFCVCTPDFTGDQCIQINNNENTSPLSSEGDTVGLSVGLFLGVTIATVLIVAAMCFFQKTLKPWMRKVKERRKDTKIYYDGAAVIHENLAVTEGLLDDTTELNNGVMNRAIDNPIYGYIPPQVQIHRTQPLPNPTDHTYSTVGGSSDQVPDTVIVNQAHTPLPDDGNSFKSPFVPDPLGNSDASLPGSYQICDSITDQTAQATQL